MVELGAVLNTTTGVVARAGAVKVALVRLLTTLMETNVLRVTHACVVRQVNAAIVVGVRRRRHVATADVASVEQRGAWRRTGPHAPNPPTGERRDGVRPAAKRATHEDGGGGTELSGKEAARVHGPSQRHRRGNSESPHDVLRGDLVLSGE